jgi:hypothetical protein
MMELTPEVSLSSDTLAPSTNIPSARNLCAQCQSQEARYKCPQCQVRTCSVPCVQAHKRSLNCSGVRNRTQYVPLESYDENMLFSDYQLLEDTARIADTTVRIRKTDPGIRNAMLGAGHRQNSRQRLLVTAAGKRGARLRFMPSGMSRALVNKSIWDVR